MQLTFLGTGAAMPTGDRFQSGLLLESGGSKLLIDCGSGVLHRLAESDAGYESLDGILLTHHHLDHIADLLPLLKARWLANAGSVPITGPPGTRMLLEDMLSAHEYLADKVKYSVREVEESHFEFAGFEVDAMETHHSMQCHAYRLMPSNADDGAEQCVTISGDTEAFEDLISFAEGSNALIHDCSFPDHVEKTNHPTPSKLGDVLAGHDVGTVYLTHLYPHTQGHHREMLETLSEQYDGQVAVPRDGMRVSI